MIVFPMAGLSARFTRAGYECPKYMLPLGVQTMFATAVSGFKAYFDREPFLFVCRDIADTPDFVRHELSKMASSPTDVYVTILNHETEGQAETVYLGLQDINASDDQPLTIFNIDSHRHNFTYPDTFELSEIDGYLEVFHSEGTHWSFVKPDPLAANPYAVGQVTEKQRISNLCSTGLYYFRRVGLFRHLYEETLSKEAGSLQGGERYVAPLYNSAIQQGYDIRYAIIPQDAITFTGTPNEYNAYLARLTGDANDD